MTTVAGSSSSASAGHVCAVAGLTEWQQMTGESSPNYNVNLPAFHMLPSSSRFCCNRLDQVAENYPSAQSPVNISANGGMTPARDEGVWGIDLGSEVAKAGTSCASSDVSGDAFGISMIPQDGFHNVSESIVPESYEEQMMLAMAMSLAEGRTMTSGVGPRSSYERSSFSNR